MPWQCWSLTTTITSLSCPHCWQNALAMLVFDHNNNITLYRLFPSLTYDRFSQISAACPSQTGTFWHLENLATSLQSREVRRKRKKKKRKKKRKKGTKLHNVQPQGNNHQNIWKYQISVAKYIHGKEKSPFWTACSSTFPSFQTYPAILAHAFVKSPGVFACLCNTGQDQILFLKGASHIGKEEK